MHYNHFTIQYIEAIKQNLKIEVVNDKANFFPDLINVNDVINLKNAIDLIWEKSDSAIKVVKEKTDAFIQSGLFGLINDFDTALKVGFSLGDRIVLIDYLYDRVLLKKAPSKIDIIHLGIISSSLVSLLPLAKEGRVVIIPNPFSWYPESKKIISEASQKTELTPSIITMLNMLSIIKVCQLHPYTIAESNEFFNTLINEQIDNVDIIGKDAANYAYEGILGGLLSEKLLNNIELKFALNLPLSKYYSIVSSNNEFYSNYLSALTSGGSLNSQNTISNIRNKITKHIDSVNKSMTSYIPKTAAKTGSIAGGTIALLGTIAVISAPLAITGAALGLSSTLIGLLIKENTEENPIINVFGKLHNAAKLQS